MRRALPAAIGGLGVGVLVLKETEALTNFNKIGFANRFASFSIMTAQADSKCKCQDMVKPEIHIDKRFNRLFLRIRVTAFFLSCT